MSWSEWPGPKKCGLSWFSTLGCPKSKRSHSGNPLVYVEMIYIPCPQLSWLLKVGGPNDGYISFFSSQFLSYGNYGRYTYRYLWIPTGLYQPTHIPNKGGPAKNSLRHNQQGYNLNYQSTIMNQISTYIPIGWRLKSLLNDWTNHI